MRLFSYFTKKVRSKILNICFPVRFAKFLRTCLLRNTSRKQHPEVFLEKGVLKIRSKFTREHPCRIAISIKLHSKGAKEHLWTAASDLWKTAFEQT